jgi:hypothetical protein
MRIRRIVPFAALFALAAALPDAASAQQASQLRGTWNLDAQASDDINAKINESIRRMNVLVRQIARPRLRSTNTAYPTLVLRQDGGNVRIDMAGRPSVSSPANGTGVRWQRETGRECTEVRGDCVEVTTTYEGNRLRQTFRAEDGQRVNVFSVSPDGNTMTMAVTVESPRLPAPLTYNLVYNRAN